MFRCMRETRRTRNWCETNNEEIQYKKNRQHSTNAYDLKKKFQEKINTFKKNKNACLTYNIDQFNCFTMT